MIDGLGVALITLHLEPASFGEGRRASVLVEIPVLQAAIQPAQGLFGAPLEAVAISNLQRGNPLLGRIPAELAETRQVVLQGVRVLLLVVVPIAQVQEEIAQQLRSA